MKVGDIVSVRFLQFIDHDAGTPYEDVWYSAKIVYLDTESLEVKFINGEKPDEYDYYTIGMYQEGTKWRFEKSM